MFMSTRYKKKDPEWRKKALFNIDDSLAKLLECLSIEYSVSKLISPKWKNFRSQKLKFESKTRINNAIWRCWHIQYKDRMKPAFFKFDMPFSDQTVHSTPQAVILEGKSWKRRLDTVSREYKKWRKFYNFKILKGGGTEEKDNLKQLSNENSEDDFTSDEEEDNKRKKHRVSPTKVDMKTAVPGQKLFESTNFELDTYLADLPDTLFSSIRPVKPTVENSLGLTFSDLSDMIQPTLDQLNPCFDELLQNFDFLTNDWSSLQSNSRSLETVQEHSDVQPLQEMMNMSHDDGQLQQNFLSTDPMYSDATYLYSSGVLYTPNPNAPLDKARPSMGNLAPMPADDNSDQGLQFNLSTRKDDSAKRALPDAARDITGTSPPRKVVVKEVDKTSQFLTDDYLQRLHLTETSQSSISQMNLIQSRNDNGNRTSNFEALLSNAIGSSSSQGAPANIITESIPIIASVKDASGTAIEATQQLATMPDENSQQIIQRKMFVNQTSTTKVIEYAELPPQLQAPNLTAHLQAVMSTRAFKTALPRNKSDTQLSSLAEKFAFPSSVKNMAMRRDSSTSTASRGKRMSAKFPRNRSDTNLVQMAQDSCRVLTRRRLSSISVDSKPLILPKNFSDSNLCALGRGVSKRPQPILPKSLIAIVPPAQTRPPGAITRVAVTQVDTIVAQTTVSGGQFTTFMVNKQQPTSTDPVQVTFYMPKNTKPATVTTSAVADQTAAPTQRVEVIQYKGQQLDSHGKHMTAIVPSVTVAPNINATKAQQQQPTAFQAPLQAMASQKNVAMANENPTLGVHSEPLTSSVNEVPFFTGASNCQSAANQSLQSTVVRPIAVSSVIHKTSSSQTPFKTSSSFGDQSNNTSTPNFVPASSLATSNIQTAEPLNSKVPVVVPNIDKTEQIAPLQGLSEQQLVSLAQILQGSRAGTVGQETTIAYLEMLQKHLSTLLMQQQGMLKSQQDGAASAQYSTDNGSSNLFDRRIDAVSVSTQNAASLDSAVVHSLQNANVLPLSRSNPNCGATEHLSVDLEDVQRQSDNMSFRITNAATNAPQPQHDARASLPHYQSAKASDLNRDAMHPEAEILLTGQTRSTISLTSSSAMKQHQRQQKQNVVQNNQTLQPISTQIFIPRGTPMSVKNSDAKQMPVSEPQLSPAVRYLSVQNLLQPASRPVEQQILQFPYGPSSSHPSSLQLATQPATQPAIQPAMKPAMQPAMQLAMQPATESGQLGIQHPVLIGVQSTPHFPTADSSLINLPFTQALSSSQVGILKNKSSSEPLLRGTNIVVITGTNQVIQKTSARPTMVDLAIAASQRTYLTDKSSALGGTSLENSASFASTDGSSTSVVNCVVQSISTIVMSDSSPSTESDAANAKRSRLRFEDREVYKEYRRKNHVTAEQKRRGLIKVAFEQLISLIPGLQEYKQGRTSKALVLQKAVDYIDHLQREKELTQYKIEKMRREVNRLNEEIKVCQQKLPAGGAVSEQENTRDAKTSYLEHVRERIKNDQKYWLFSVMLRPLFESFNNNTVTQTLQEFIHSVLKWCDENCSLQILRTAVIASLRQISTDTAILSDPSSLPAQALQAASSQDPTILGQQPGIKNQQSLSAQIQPHAEMQGTIASALINNQNTVQMPMQSREWSNQ